MPIAFSPDGTTLATLVEGQLSLLSIDTYRFFKRRQIMPSFIERHRMRFSQDGGLLFVWAGFGGDTDGIDCVRVSDLEVLWSFPVDQCSESPGFSLGNEIVAIAGLNPNLIHLLDCRTGRELRHIEWIPRHPYMIHHLAFSQDDKTLFAANLMTIAQFDVQSGQLLSEDDSKHIYGVWQMTSGDVLIIREVMPNSPWLKLEAVIGDASTRIDLPWLDADYYGVSDISYNGRYCCLNSLEHSRLVALDIHQSTILDSYYGDDFRGEVYAIHPKGSHVVVDLYNRVAVYPMLSERDDPVEIELLQRRDLPAVFLSHSSVDSPLVQRLATDLQKEHFAVWLDEAELDIGDSLLERIAEGIHGSRYFAVVLTPASVTSKWVKQELEVAMDRQFSENRVVVLPLLLAECEIPKFLRGKKYCDMRGPSYQSGFQNLVRRLRRPVPKRKIKFSTG